MSSVSSAAPARLSLFGIAWPIFVEQSLRMMVGVVDTLIVSHISDGAVAALGVANQIILFFIISFNFIGIGSSVVLTHYLGAKDKSGADQIARTAVVANTWLGLIFSFAVWFFAEPLLKLMDLPVSLMPYALPFLQLMGGTLFFEAFNSSMAGVLRAHKFTRPAMYVAMGQNVVNFVGSYVFIFGLWGAPRLGVVGVAAASVFSRFVASSVLNWVLIRRVGLRLQLVDFYKINVERVRRVLRIGLPAAAENICYWTAFMFVTRQVASLGERSLAVQQYTMQLQRVVIIFTIAIGLATEILVGHHVGAGQIEMAYKQPIASVRKGMLLAIGLVALIALGSPWLAAAFTQDPEVIAGCVLLMRLSILIEAGRVFNIVLINSLRATGDVSFPMQMAVISMWFVWVPMAWAAVHFGYGLVGIWLAMATDEWVRGLMMLRRWRQRSWVPFAQRSREQVLEAQ